MTEDLRQINSAYYWEERALKAEAEIERLKAEHEQQIGRARDLFTMQLEKTQKAEARLANVVEAKRGLSPAPCDICGYNGPGYYQSDTHTCVTVRCPKDIAAALEALRNNPALQAALRGEGEK